MDKATKFYFGGTFDPFHNGHLTIAKHIAEYMAIDEITLLPAHIPPHKASPSVNSAHRLAMLNALAQQESLFRLDARELNREKPSYTIDTLKEIKSEQPNTAINFIIGMDSLLSLTSWYQWQSILKHTNLIVCTRPGYPIDNQHTQVANGVRAYIIEKKDFNSARSGQILLAPPVDYDVSSTTLKLHLSQSGISDHVIRHLPKSIVDYILSHQLYIK